MSVIRIYHQLRYQPRAQLPTNSFTILCIDESMAKFSNPVSWDSEGNLLVPRHGIRMTMGLALLAAGVWLLLTFLTDAELRKVNPLEPRAFPESLWTMILWAALPLVPFVVSGWLLSRHSEEAIAAGSGVAVGLFLCSLLFSVTAALSLVVSFAPTPYAAPRGLLSLAFSACSIWIIVSGFRIANKAGWGAFWLALSATLIGMTVAYHWLGSN